MKSSVGLWATAAVVWISILGCRASEARKQEERTAAALFGQFESVVFAEASLLYGRASHQLPKEVSGPLQSPFYILVGGLDALGKGVSADVLSNAEAVMVGTKNYLPPAGLGPVRSQNCYVVILRAGRTLNMRKHFARQFTALAGELPVWNWSAELGEFGELDPRHSALFAVQIENSYLLVSNSLEELRVIALNLSSTRSDSLMLSGIRNWEAINQHEMWGYRRYRHDAILDKLAAGTTHITPGAEALVFTLDRKRNSFALQVICSPGDESTPALINSMALFGRLKPLGNGVWEKTLPLAGDPAETLDRLVAVMGMLGFGGYV